MNRDMNACMNMLYISKSWIQLQTRPAEFCRTPNPAEVCITSDPDSNISVKEWRDKTVQYFQNIDEVNLEVKLEVNLDPSVVFMI